jgi:hypothetical protein
VDAPSDTTGVWVMNFAWVKITTRMFRLSSCGQACG